jgi:cytoskeletal protein CcmA (bactofilin family)
VADKRKTEIMPGFELVRSLGKAQEEARKHAPPPVQAASSRAPAVPGAAPHAVFARTVEPTRRTVRCFRCGYEFRFAGGAKDVYCAKCHAKIDLSDRTIAGVFSGEIFTAGHVWLKPGSRLEGARIVAGSVRFEGGMDETSHLEATQWLELGPGATYEPRLIDTESLRVAAGAKAVFHNRFFVKHLDIFGTVEGDVEASGLVSIRAGGFFAGKLKSQHLEVEEGGGLRARCFIWPEGR